MQKTMTKIMYQSQDDGTLYHSSDVDGGTENGTEVEGFTAWRIRDDHMTADDWAVGQNDIIEIMLNHDPPLAERV
jgi:hypothetical protein